MVLIDVFGGFGVQQCETTSGQHYTIGEKSSVTLYTYIDHHAGKPKSQSWNTVSLCVYKIFFNLRVPDNSNMVLEREG